MFVNKYVEKYNLLPPQQMQSSVEVFSGDAVLFSEKTFV